MNYATIKMISKATNKHQVTVHRALKNAGVVMEKTPGVKGFRLPLNVANKFIARQWPEYPPMQPVTVSPCKSSVVNS
jgi:hypothetical protein